jgi:hypothetical protein
MVSIALLEHTATAPPPFNGLFYATAATIIPVLFLAIAVQGRTYENLIKTFSDAFRDWTTPSRWIPRLPAGAIAFTASMAGLMLLYSAGSEIAAIYALYHQQATRSTAQFILIAATFMIIMTAAGPTLTYWRAVILPMARGSKWIITGRSSPYAKPEAPGADQAAPAPHPQSNPEPEPGKTDSD